MLFQTNTRRIAHSQRMSTEKWNNFRTTEGAVPANRTRACARQQIDLQICTADYKSVHRFAHKHGDLQTCARVCMCPIHFANVHGALHVSSCVNKCARCSANLHAALQVCNCVCKFAPAFAHVPARSHSCNSFCKCARRSACKQSRLQIWTAVCACAVPFACVQSHFVACTVQSEGGRTAKADLNTFALSNTWELIKTGGAFLTPQHRRTRCGRAKRYSATGDGCI